MDALTADPGDPRATGATMPLRRRLEWKAISGLVQVVRGAPRPASLALGGCVGRVAYTLDAARRRTALTNLERAFPARPAHERRAIARQVFGHFGRLLVEVLSYSALSPERMLSLIEVEGEERVRHAYAGGRGVLFFTGHFGFWEIHAMAHGLFFEPIAVVGRALDNPRLNALLEQVRGCTGNRIINRRGGVRAILRALQAREGVAMLIDQHIHPPDAVSVEFFNQAASTTPALAALALRTGAPVIPVFALPLPGHRYRLIYDHAVAPPPADSPDPIRDFTQRCTDVLEMYVRRYPHLWLWMHRRWRNGDERPPALDADGAVT
jgi:KDO2-lipid IV(A) lauroyltransferase